MGVTDFFAGELLTELIKQLLVVCKKSTLCKSAAESLIVSIEELHPIIHEIKYTGVELPQFRQRQIDQLSETFREAMKLAHKVLASPRWNVYKNLQLARKMERVEQRISRFMTVTIQAHVLADVHQLRVDNAVGLENLERRIGGLRIGGAGDGVWIDEAVKMVEDDEREKKGSLVSIGAGLVLGKKKVKEMIMERDDFGVVGICGIGGCGKTTLAQQICRDDQVRRHFSNNVIFLTVSQSPNVEQLRQNLLAKITSANHIVGSSYGVVPQWNLQYDWRIRGRTLVILDDVWSLPVLEQLIFNIPGCKTLVVSRFKFPVFNSTYELELLRDDEAMSLFCYSAFGQKSIPLAADQRLVEQVVKECKGLPLALKVIGASLRDQPQMFWTSAKNRLSRGEAICESHETKLLERMAISITYLPRKVKECFLDLGSFPEDKKIPLDVLINMWVEIHDIDEEEAFAILIELSNKNLVTIVKDARAGDNCSSYFDISVTQHDVLRDMALHLSNRDCVNERRRLLMPRREERLPREWERNMCQAFQAQIVSIHTGEMKECDWFYMDFPEVEVLILNFSASEYYLPPFINRMPKLKALIVINSGNSNTILGNLSVFAAMHNLRSLWLEKTVVPQQPNTTIPSHNLRKISLVLCEVNNNLDGSLLDFPHNLHRLSDLTLDHCVNLTKLPSSICKNNSLKSLSITNCHDLQNLPTELGKLNRLQILRLCACPSLKNLPYTICELEQLKYLDISQCVDLRTLPEWIGSLSRLEKIDMRECPSVRNLPASVASLRQLCRVICDEETAWLWKDVANVLPELRIQVAEECFTLDWLAD